MNAQLLQLLVPPGWSPDGCGDTGEKIKARWAGFRTAQSQAESKSRFLRL